MKSAREDLSDQGAPLVDEIERDRRLVLSKGSALRLLAASSGGYDLPAMTLSDNLQLAALAAGGLFGRADSDAEGNTLWRAWPAARECFQKTRI